jgi:MFS family permease
MSVPSFPTGLSDRLPRRVVYAAGLLFFAAGYLGLAVVRQAWLVFAVLAVHGGFNACTDGVGKAWISTLLPAGAQGTGQGLYQGLTGAATLIAGGQQGRVAEQGDGEARGPAPPPLQAR